MHEVDTAAAGLSQDILTGERVLLRSPRDEDGPALHAAYFSDSECARFLQRSIYRDQEQSILFLCRLRSGLLRDNGEMFGWVIADRHMHSPIGVITCIPEGRDVQIHYGLAKQNWGLGLVTEAVKLATMALLDSGRFDCIQTTLASEHLASRAVLEKAGFELQEYLPEALSLPAVGSTRRDAVRYRFARGFA